MNAQALTGELPLATRRSPWVPRLVSAEFLKLRKRRGLVATAVVLTVGAMLIAYAVLLGLHASDPVEYGVAGGMENFVGSMGVLSLLSVVAAILVGATLGTGDVGAGVFRELVVTGRSRFALFAARVPAGLGLLLPIVGAAFAITTGASTAFAGSKGAEVVHVGPGAWENTLGNVAPNAGLLLESAGWLALVTVAGFLLALGVSSLLGSRATSIGLLLAWWLVAMPLLLLRPRLSCFSSGQSCLSPSARGEPPRGTHDIAKTRGRRGDRSRRARDHPRRSLRPRPGLRRTWLLARCAERPPAARPAKGATRGAGLRRRGECGPRVARICRGIGAGPTWSRFGRRRKSARPVRRSSASSGRTP